MKTPILGGYAVARSVNAADNRLMNLYPEATPEGGKTSGFLTRCPGYKYVSDVGSGPIRGLWTFGGFLYVVSGVELYKVDGDWTATLLGTVSGSGPVSMSDNGDQLFVACNPRSYTYSVASNTFAEITDPDFPGAVTVGFINGYFVFNEPNSQKVWITSYQDGASVDPLEFAYTDANPDNLLSLIVNRNEIWMFGTTSTEVWYYSGDIDFPLARIQGAFNEIGCAAPYSVAKLDNTVFWLGSDPRGNAMVYKAAGYGAQRVSTHGIEKVLQGYQFVGDAIGYSYQQEGHTFYVLSFPSANATWCFDAATNEWHERGSWKQGRYNRHRSNCQANFNNTIVLGDFQVGKLYEFDLEYYKDDVGTQRWVRSWRALPPNANNLNRTAHHSLQVELETGTETISSQSVIPCVPVTLDPTEKATNATLSNGDLTITSAGGDVSARSTTSKNSGKHYFEVLVDATSAGYWDIGGIGEGNPTDYNSWAGNLSAVLSYGLQVTIGGYDAWINGGATSIGFSPPAANDVVMFAIDFDAGIAWSGVNNVWDGDPATGVTGIGTYTFTPGTTMYAYGSQVNAGQTTMQFATASLSYSPPTGFTAWDDCVPSPGTYTERNPKVLLRWSDDGGHTWSNYYDRDMGSLGEYWTRVIWRRLGMTTKLRDRVYELSGSDPVKITLTGAELILSGTNS